MKFLMLALATWTLVMSPMTNATAAEPGAAIVTVTGKITATNRGPFDSFKDGLFNYHERSFNKAHAFDRSALEALDMREISLKYADWPREITFRGPSMASILDKVGATGSTVSVQALDGYAAKFDITMLRKGPALLAIESDGKPLGIGGRGPSWLVFPEGLYKEQKDGNDAGLVWAVFHIAIE